MIRHFALFACACMLLAASPVAAQPPRGLDASVGYQVLHIPDETYPFGLNFDVAGHVTPRVQLVGEFGWARDTQNEPGVTGTLNFINLGGGPRWSMRHAAVAGRAFEPFVQLLAGAVHADADIAVNGSPINTGNWAFMLQPGGGITIPLTPAVRALGQFDYRRAFFDTGENEFRFVFGIRIGAR